MHSPLFLWRKFLFFTIYISVVKLSANFCRVEYNSYLCGRISKLIRT